MILYYDHKRRTVYREDIGDHSIPISLTEAEQAYQDCAIDDCNIAFTRLASCNFDTEAVELEYRAEE